MANTTKYNSQQQPTHFLRLPAVKNRTALSGSSIWAKVKNGTFPKPVSLGNRFTAWRSDDIREWMDNLNESNKD